MERKSCIICESTDLTLLHTLPQFPLYTHTTNTQFDNDRYNDLIFVACNKCSTVQLGTLVDPNELYEFSHNLTFHTPTWLDHHKQLAEFILQSGPIQTITEVGGSSGALAREILSSNSHLNYSILDLCNSPPDVSGIKFIHGNCETHSYKPNSVVILSHVFEHLYTPRQFLQAISNSNVKSVFISIPDMKKWLDDKVLSFVHREHTFYCDEEIIKFLFESYGYTCTKQHCFKTHSIFYHFEKTGTADPILPYRPTLVTQFNDYLLSREASIHKLSLSTEISIFPAGHYGQLLYYYLSNKNIRIKHFYDNDISKQGGRVYGTNSIVLSPKTLSKNNNPETIVLCATVYRDEIMKGLLAINPSLTIVTV